jgi:hypothetical protein
MSLAVRTLGYVLAAFMAFMGAQKFFGAVPIFQIIEDNLAAQWGLDFPWVEPWLKYLTGALELISALLVVLGLRLAGGSLALLVLIGAVGAHLTVLGVNTPMSSAPGAGGSAVLFIMALGFLAVAIFVTWMSRPVSVSPGG